MLLRVLLPSVISCLNKFHLLLKCICVFWSSVVVGVQMDNFKCILGDLHLGCHLTE